MATVAAVVVTYNRKALLMQCIERIRAQRGASCRIYVIDNASTDGTEQAVQQLCGADLLYCNTGKNLGGAGGFWYGLRRAAEDGCDYFWLMDDDTLPEPDALALLLQADTLLKGRYGWLSSRALTLEGADQPMNRQRKTPYRDIDGYDAELVPSVMASFVSLFLPAKTVFLYGLPFREFFIWSDDWEYTRRISRQEAC
ncbi:MAG: glycosyltransferase [Gemmiger sp.]